MAGARDLPCLFAGPATTASLMRRILRCGQLTFNRLGIIFERLSIAIHIQIWRESTRLCQLQQQSFAMIGERNILPLAVAERRQEIGRRKAPFLLQLKNFQQPRPMPWVSWQYQTTSVPHRLPDSFAHRVMQ